MEGVEFNRCCGLVWVGLDWVGFSWVWIGFDWFGLDWFGLDWQYFVWYSWFPAVWRFTLAPLLNSAFILSTQSLESAVLSKIKQLCSMLEFNFSSLILCVHWFISPVRKTVHSSLFVITLFFFLPLLYRWIMIRIPIPQSRDILGKSTFALPVTGKAPIPLQIQFTAVRFNVSFGSTSFLHWIMTWNWCCGRQTLCALAAELCPGHVLECQRELGTAWLSHPALLSCSV